MTFRLNVFFAVAFGIAALCSPTVARADSFTQSLTGVFTTDDNVSTFDFAINTQISGVTIRSYGFGGGTLPNSTVIPVGGFDTLFTLYALDTVSGNYAFITDNDDDATGTVTPDNGKRYDSLLLADLDLGQYRLAVSQAGNFGNFVIPQASSFPAEFSQFGNTTYTSVNQNGGGVAPFVDNTGVQRTGNFALSITAVNVPEAGSLSLLAVAGIGVLGAGGIRRRK